MSTQKKLHVEPVHLKFETESSILVIDDAGKMWQLLKIYKPEFKPRDKPISPWTCYRKEKLCHWARDGQLKRPHGTCFECRLRMMVGGELPFMIEVTPYIQLIAKKRPRWKALLGKKLTTASELVSQ